MYAMRGPAGKPRSGFARAGGAPLFAAGRELIPDFGRIRSRRKIRARIENVD
jgi:hypothetical protein